MKNDIAEFRKDMNKLLEKYNISDIVVVVGIIRDKNIIDEAILARGNTSYLAAILNHSFPFIDKVHEFIDELIEAHIQKKIGNHGKSN